MFQFKISFLVKCSISGAIFYIQFSGKKNKRKMFSDTIAKASLCSVNHDMYSVGEKNDTRSLPGGSNQKLFESCPFGYKVKAIDF